MTARIRIPAVFLGLAAAASLGACAEPGETSPNFGAAVRHNMAVHIINPAPDYGPGAQPTGSGRRQALATERYATGTVIRPPAPSTTTGALSKSEGSGGSE
ncbi:hypothetical protein C882_0873 [Caenispirillum salinarum AK4]|uniref:Lipoprotein n=1 Tax=Caenispirillum salinarum AK4 TaxID=1238182 RepID=K9HJA0_9PROT|nr:hypothetical protein [Caenispirillum salinarum]EKV28661.1 hypothetical protein C882_0873 [Caenispirillum salinarum AK4]